MTIVRSYRVAIFVFYVDTYMARAMCPPRYRSVKKPSGASLNRNDKIDFFTDTILKHLKFHQPIHSLKYGWETNVTLTEVHPASPMGLIVNTTKNLGELSVKLIIVSNFPYQFS